MQWQNCGSPVEMHVERVPDERFLQFALQNFLFGRPQIGCPQFGQCLIKRMYKPQKFDVHSKLKGCV